MAFVPTEGTFSLPPCVSASDGNKLGRLRQFPGATAGADETWASGIAGIRQVAWLGDAVTDEATPTFSGSTITINSTGAVAGTLFVWAKS